MPNFEALGVPNSKRRGRTHPQTDGRTTPHRPIVKDFFETFTKMSRVSQKKRHISFENQYFLKIQPPTTREGVYNRLIDRLID